MNYSVTEEINDSVRKRGCKRESRLTKRSFQVKNLVFWHEPLGRITHSRGE